ncbi:MAG: 23S rRNA (guanosine(2251)-2'-O)-methyltransferase RlmB [bacterium]|nr:23S rRNA (guanosine(2251)-2'-O)-methyltransferase RlmB [bacterium]
MKTRKSKSTNPAGRDHRKPHFNSSRRPEEPRPPIPVPGRRPVEELLAKGIQPERVLIAKREHTGKPDPLTERCLAAGWKVEYVDRQELDQQAEFLHHQGFLAYIHHFPYLSLQRLQSDLQSIEAPLLIALDEVQDAGNLGAILRSTECAGASAALIPYYHSASVTAAVIRSSAGAALHLPLCRVINLAKALEELQESGMRIVGADQEQSRSLYDVDLTGPLVLVVGSEGHGLRPGVRKRCDELVSIPLLGRVGSLNASVAAAICLFEAVRQRTTLT